MFTKEKKSGKILTFYSYKGGVGRSMALANVAWLLADHDNLIGEKSKRRILIVDWDLEAPGLHRFLGLKDEEVTSGILDLFYYYKEFLGKKVDKVDDNFINLDKFTISIPKKLTNGLPISFIPAGRQDDKYASRVHGFDWQDFYKNWFGYPFVDYLQRKFREYAEVTLIDSRTGITDIGGICTMQIPDLVVLMFAINGQNILGIKKIAKGIVSKSTSQTDREKPPDLLLVPARVDITEKERNDLWMEKGAALLTGYLPHKSEKANLKYLKKNIIQYRPHYSFGEDLAAKDEDMILKPDFDNLTKKILINSKLWYKHYEKRAFNEMAEEDSAESSNQILFENDLKQGYGERLNHNKISTTTITVGLFGKRLELKSNILFIAILVAITILIYFVILPIIRGPNETQNDSVEGQRLRNETSLELIKLINNSILEEDVPDKYHELANTMSSIAVTHNEKAIVAVSDGEFERATFLLENTFSDADRDSFQISQAYMINSLIGILEKDTLMAISNLDSAYNFNKRYMDSLDASVNFMKVIRTFREKPFYNLRSTPATLDHYEAGQMFKTYGFYCNNTGMEPFPEFHNLEGKGIDNEYGILNFDEIADYSTGLIWLAPDSSIKMPFILAKNEIEDLNQDIRIEIHKWRLPTLEEAMSLVEPMINKRLPLIDTVFGYGMNEIWTSDSVKEPVRYIWTVNFTEGQAEIGVDSSRFAIYQVLPVRNMTLDFVISRRKISRPY